MGVNYYFKDTTTDRFLIYTATNNEEQIYGEYGDLKSLSAAFTWISKYRSHYANSQFKIRKVRVTVDDIGVTEDENKYIDELRIKKGINLEWIK